MLSCKLSKEKQRLTKLNISHNIEVTSSEEITKVIENVYSDLYTSNGRQLGPRTRVNWVNARSEVIPEISTEEIWATFRKMKNGKWTVEDCVTSEMLKHGVAFWKESCRCFYISVYTRDWYPISGTTSKWWSSSKKVI